MESPDGWIHITYTWSNRNSKSGARACIRYVSFTQDWFKRHSWRKGFSEGLYLGAQTLDSMEEDPMLIH